MVIVYNARIPSMTQCYLSPPVPTCFMSSAYARQIEAAACIVSVTTSNSLKHYDVAFDVSIPILMLMVARTGALSTVETRLTRIYI